MNLEKLNLTELKAEELKSTNGGIAPLIVVGAIYLGSAVAGGAIGYGMYKAIDWLTGTSDD